MYGVIPLILCAIPHKEYTQKTFILAICLTLTLSSITLLQKISKKKSPKIESKLK